MMTLSRSRVNLHGSGGYPAWKWVYNLEGIPDPRFGSSSGTKGEMIALAKHYNMELRDTTVSSVCGGNAFPDMAQESFARR